MPSFWMFLPIAHIAGSFIAGFIFFYLMSALPKAKKKQQAEEVTSLLINFVIYIWIGKILLNFFVFIKDPLAVLAYPSNSHAFYLAVLFSGIHIWYKKKRRKLDWQLLLHSFIHVFLFASFIYELIDVIWMGNSHLLGYLSLLFVLLLALIMLQNSVSMAILNKGLLFIWGAGQLALAFIMPFATVYGYMMAPWFLGLFLIVNILWFLYEKKYIVRR